MPSRRVKPGRPITSLRPAFFRVCVNTDTNLAEHGQYLRCRSRCQIPGHQQAVDHGACPYVARSVEAPGCRDDADKKEYRHELEGDDCEQWLRCEHQSAA